MFPRLATLLPPALTPTCGLLFLAGAHLLHGVAVDAHNRGQLVELGAHIMERAERTIDYAFLGLVELVEVGAIDCTEASLAMIRRKVYERASIRDIRVTHGPTGVACAAFPEMGTFAVGRDEARRYPGRNSSIAFVEVDEETGPGFGLSWRLAGGSALFAVINTDGLLADMLPAELRQSGRIDLMLGGDSPVAAYLPRDLVGLLPASRPHAFTHRSQRYPLTSAIHVDAGALARWNKEPNQFVLAGGLIAGLLFGALAARALTRPRSALSELDLALARREFVPYLQPIFCLRTGNIVGCEALARWLRSDGTIVSPMQFIPLAEQNGRIEPLTHQLVSTTLDRLRPLMRRDKSFKVAFNITADQVLSVGFVDALRAAVRKARVSPRQVVVELTERQELTDLDRAASVVSRLRDHGFKIAIDDAGTGHSGLSYIQKLGVNIIKIDKFFIDSLGQDQAAQAVVETLVRLARRLGMTTVAEGVEAQAQLIALQVCGVDEGQGYIVAPPLPVDDFLALVEARTATAPVLAGAAAA